jgi:hypothetical protein
LFRDIKHEIIAIEKKEKIICRNAAKQKQNAQENSKEIQIKARQ